jgi:hypothetical protein
MLQLYFIFSSLLYIHISILERKKIKRVANLYNDMNKSKLGILFFAILEISYMSSNFCNTTK